MSEWTVVVPVKGTPAAKSRLGGRGDLALAIALDSVEQAAGAARVIVVTSPEAAAAFRTLGAQLVIDPGGGLAPAIRAGLAAAPATRVAVMLGDVPAMHSAELAAALAAAEGHPLAFVPDADDDGTVLIAALDAHSHAPAFGAHSRAAHLAAGYVELETPRESGLRRDVDTPAQLASLPSEALGPRTRAVLAG